jgi:hypothetical protein
MTTPQIEPIPMTTVQTMFEVIVPEIPPAPTDIYLVLSFYRGPGWMHDQWRLHKREWASQQKAEEFARGLPLYETYRQIIKIECRAITAPKP